MIFLSTTDNNLGISFSALAFTGENAAEVYKDLSNIANLPLKELCAKNPSLIVFPKILGETRDGIENQKIFEMSGSFENPLNAKITTGNLMGFVGFRNTQVSIQSRFTQSAKSEGGDEDFFLHYMLEKVGVANLFDLQHSTKRDRYFDFLTFLFPLFLKKALLQGLFKTYRRFEHNDANIRGVVDVSRHIHKNIPFACRVAYNTRERTFDNPVTELIRHTIELIKTKPFGKYVLSHDEETKIAVSEIIQATGSYNIRERDQVIAQNAKPLNHPYFTAYNALQKLCLAILIFQKIAYRKDSNKVYGILFDGAWLWEEYLARVLKKEGFRHPRNKDSAGGIRMFQNDSDEFSFDKNFRRIYPDFYRPNDEPKGGFILDAKYKRLQNGIGREDLYQVVTYMHTMKIDFGGFLYPIKENDTVAYADENSGAIILSQHYKLSENGYGGEIYVLGIRIPKAKGENLKEKHEMFHARMKEIEEELLNSLRNSEAL